jgi:hypothetical protein
VPSIRQLVDEILADDVTGGGRSAAHSSRAAASLRASQSGEGASEPYAADGAVTMARMTSFHGTENLKKMSDLDV